MKIYIPRPSTTRAKAFLNLYPGILVEKAIPIKIPHTDKLVKRINNSQYIPVVEHPQL